MMKGGKDDEKGMSPLFPRLHVNDADKGGPRAPPRNKMALYEQLSIPSQKFNPAAAASPPPIPLPPYSTGALIPSASSSQGGGREKSLFSPFYMHQSSNATNFRPTRTDLVRSFIGHTNNKPSIARVSEPECNSFRQHDFSRVKSPRLEKIDDEDDFRVPTFLHSNKDNVMETKRPTPSIRFPKSYDKSLEEASADPKLRIHGRNPSEQNPKEVVVIKENKDKSVFHLENGEGHKNNKRVCLNVPDKAIYDAENEDALRVTNESCVNRGSDDKVSRSEELKNAYKIDEVSETSMVDSISGLEVSPDDVVEVIGPKQFWRARRAIVNQQRVFAVQVFELHRLIKVQKLIAASPYLLLEETPYLSGSPQKVPHKNPPPEPDGKPQPFPAKQTDDSRKLNPNSDSQTETIPVPPLPSHDSGNNKGLRNLPRYVPYPGNPPAPAPFAPESKPAPWCYPPTNHWLVPVMSPSEGLIYKPYPGPCPPAPGFMAPSYGDFMSTPYTLPASHQQPNMAALPGAPAIPPNYFPAPYGLPLVNPNISTSISTSAVKQLGPLIGPRPSVQVEQRSRSSCNMGPHWKAPTSKDSELQGSTASSPFKRAQEGGRADALPLFPTVPATEVSGSGLGSAHPVIKVVPHNARSATESAARIFLSIQKEREQNES